VVTLAGELPVSRFGLTIMNNLGLGEVVANSPKKYVEIAVTLAKDSARLKEYRRTLRGRLLASHLTDAVRFTRQLEETYRWMWEQWCAANG